MSPYHLSVFLHVLASVYWLGGMFFFAAVGAPELRLIRDDRLRTELFRNLGTRFRTTAWIAILVLLVTGTSNLHFRGWLSPDVWLSAQFWATTFGRLLGLKVLLVAGMISVQLLHDFYVGPRAMSETIAPSERAELRKLASWLGRGNALLALVLLYVATRLTRG